MLHSSEDYFGKLSNQKTIKDGLVGPLGSRTDAAKQYKNSEHKWRKYLKSLKKQNKMLYSISKKSGSRREMKNIKKIRVKASKKRGDSSSNYCSNKYYSNSSLPNNSDWGEETHTAEYREVNRLDHVFINNIKTKKDQRNDAMEN